MLSLENARLWYAQADPVHGFEHIERVYRLAEHLALAEGADLEVVRAAALLHDAQPPADIDGHEAHEGSVEQSLRQAHQHASASFAAQVLAAEGWPEARIQAVAHCIRAHRFRDDSEQPATLEARVLFDADKLDAIGAVGVARAIAYAAQHEKPFYAEPSATFLARGELQPGEVHSAYHEHVFKLRRLKARLFTQTARQMAEERHRVMEAFFARLQQEIRGEA